METTAADTAPGSEGTEHEHQGTAAPGAGAVYMGSGWLFFWGGSSPNWGLVPPPGMAGADNHRTQTHTRCLGVCCKHAA